VALWNGRPAPSDTVNIILRKHVGLFITLLIRCMDHTAADLPDHTGQPVISLVHHKICCSTSAWMEVLTFCETFGEV